MLPGRCRSQIRERVRRRAVCARALALCSAPLALSPPLPLSAPPALLYPAWLDVRGVGLPDPLQACLRAGVALSDGAGFGTPGFLRLNFACPRGLLEEGLQRLQTALR